MQEEERKDLFGTLDEYSETDGGPLCDSFSLWTVGQLGKHNIGQMANVRIPQVSDVPRRILAYNGFYGRGDSRSPS